MDGGVDVILFETTFDTLNAKAGLEAAVQAMDDKGRELPIMLSLTLTGKGGRTFGRDARRLPRLCATYPAAERRPELLLRRGRHEAVPREMGDLAPLYISAYPNAGLPNQFGQYDDAGEDGRADQGFYRRGTREHRRRVLRHDAGTHRPLPRAGAWQTAACAGRTA